MDGVEPAFWFAERPLDAPRRFMPDVAARVLADEVACTRRTDSGYVGECGRADVLCERLGVAPANLFDGWQKQLARSFDGPSRVGVPLHFQCEQSQLELRLGRISGWLSAR